MKNLHKRALLEIRDLAVEHQDTCQPLADEILWVIAATEDEAPDVSSMPEGQMVNFVNNLTARGYFELEDNIGRVLDKAMERYASSTKATKFEVELWVGHPEFTPNYTASGMTRTTHCRIRVKLPAGLNQKIAWWLAERQIREQVGTL